jgi:hypothetical protein
MTALPLVLAADEIVMIAMIGGLLIAIIAMVSGFVRSMYRERARATTQREIAAYVSEGTIKPEEGERLMRAANEPTKEADG